MNPSALLIEPNLQTKLAKTAGDLMTPNPVSIRDTAPVWEARAFLVERGISGAPVIDKAGRPVGVLTQTDIVIHDHESPYQKSREYDGEDLNELFLVSTRSSAAKELVVTPMVQDLMTPIVFTTTLDSPARQVIADLVALKVHRLFVVDTNGILVGVITALDMLRRLHCGNSEGLPH